MKRKGTRKSKCARLGRTFTRSLIVSVITLAVSPLVATAQVQEQRRGWGYVFLGAGGSTGDGSAFTFSYGGGGDGLIYKGFGLGAEIGSAHAVGEFGSTVGILSANFSYNFGGRDGSKKVVPFVTGGPSLKFADDDDSGAGINLGGGVHYWAGERVGLRVEFRDHHFFKGVLNFYGVRVGAMLR